MKKTLVLGAVASMLLGGFAVAEEAVLIDFSKLNADIIAGKNGEMTQNRRTIMDFGGVAGTSFTDDQKVLLRTSLAIGQWEVVLNSSSQNPSTLAASQVREAPVSANAKMFAGEKVMGVLVAFPLWSSNANAQIRPPFLIPAYEPMAQADDEGKLQAPTEEEQLSGKTRFEDGYGVVGNVGVVKSIAVNTYGMNFPHSLYVLLRDQNDNVHRYYMGNLLFDGWKELVWNNPAYVSEVRGRELRVYPAYPVNLPRLVFEGFLITRDAAHKGGEFVGYFKDVKVIYDKAILNTVRDFADEDLWGIQTQRDLERRKIEVLRFGKIQVLRYLEKQKMATEAGFTPSGSEPAADQN